MTDDEKKIQRLLLVKAYMDGFARGADHQGGRRRHAVDPMTHAAWAAGHRKARALLTDAAQDATKLALEIVP